MKNVKKFLATYAMLKTLSKLFKDRDSGEVNNENFVMIFNTILATSMRTGADAELISLYFSYINRSDLTEESLKKLKEAIDIPKARFDKLERDCKNMNSL